MIKASSQLFHPTIRLAQRQIVHHSPYSTLHYSSAQLCLETISDSSRIVRRHGLPRGFTSRAKAPSKTPSIEQSQDSISHPLQFRLRTAMADRPRPRPVTRTARGFWANVSRSGKICKIYSNPGAVGGRTCSFWQALFFILTITPHSDLEMRLQIVQSANIYLPFQAL